MSKIKAVLLDIDGTVLDSLEFMCHAFQVALAASNLPCPSREELRTQMHAGGTLHQVYGSFYPDADLDKLVAAHRASQLENLDLAIPFPNTISTLQKLKAAGLKLAAVSTRSNVTLTKTLESAGIARFFDTIISGDDTEKQKPNPMPLFLALERLQIPPAEAIMIGDTDGDIQAGKNAGVRTIGVTFGFRGPQIAEDKPDFVVNDISEILEICLSPVTTLKNSF
jgi:pyrophosphatase PpaX